MTLKQRVYTEEEAEAIERVSDCFLAELKFDGQISTFKAILDIILGLN